MCFLPVFFADIAYTYMTQKKRRRKEGKERGRPSREDRGKLADFFHVF